MKGLYFRLWDFERQLDHIIRLLRNIRDDNKVDKVGCPIYEDELCDKLKWLQHKLVEIEEELERLYEQSSKCDETNEE